MLQNRKKTLYLTFLNYCVLNRNIFRRLIVSVNFFQRCLHQIQPYLNSWPYKMQNTNCHKVQDLNICVFYNIFILFNKWGRAKCDHKIKHQTWFEIYHLVIYFTSSRCLAGVLRRFCDWKLKCSKEIKFNVVNKGSDMSVRYILKIHVLKTFAETKKNMAMSSFVFFVFHEHKC